MPKNPKQYENTELPNLSLLKVMVLPGAFSGQVVEMFARSGATRALTPSESDLVVFTGGCDVDPKTYGQNAISGTHSNKERDKKEAAIYHDCLKNSVPMFGICRGLQFLHVMNGGKLWQDVSGHTTRHVIRDTYTEMTLEASSIHHQMVKEDVDGMYVLAVADPPQSAFYHDNISFVSRSQKRTVPIFDEIEAAFYPETGCLGVQGHPEINTNEPYQSWALNLVSEFILAPFERIK